MIFKKSGKGSHVVANARHFTVLAVDIKSSSALLDDQLVASRQAMYTAVRGAVEDASIDWDECRRYDRGDGVQVLFPADVAKADVGGTVIRRLAERIREHNADRGPSDVRLRLRAVLHAGDLERDKFGWTGYPLVVAARLLDSAELHSVLFRADAADLALIVSRTWYETIVRHNKGGVQSSTYRPVDVDVNGVIEPAWVHVPGYHTPPAPEPEPGRAEAAPPNEPAPAGNPYPGGVSINGVDLRAGGDVVGGIVLGNMTVNRSRSGRAE
jgi:hypothetical protein